MVWEYTSAVINPQHSRWELFRERFFSIRNDHIVPDIHTDQEESFG